MADWDVSAESPAPAPAPAPVDPTAAAPAPNVPAAAAAAPAAAAPTDQWVVASEAPAPQTAGGLAQAAGSGAGSFALDTAGLPVGTVRNVEEIGKAAAGSVAGVFSGGAALPGEKIDPSGNFSVTPGGLYHWRTVDGTDVYGKKPPPESRWTTAPVTTGKVPAWLQPEDDSKYQYDIGSPDFLKQQLRNLGGTNLIDVQQQTKLNRYVSAGTEGALSATIGGETSVPAVAKALTAGGIAGAASQQLSDSGVDPALANAAGLLTGAVMHRSMTPKEVAPPPSIPKATIDPAERILNTPALPGPSPAEVDSKPAKAAPGAVPDPNTPAAPIAQQEATEAGSAQGTTNNASGESSASAEAISRVDQEKAAGQTRHVIDEDGHAMPLVGVDAADTVARPGTIIVQKGVGATPVTVLDRGGLSAAQAQGLVARSQAQGYLADEAPAGTPEPSEAPPDHIQVQEHLPATAPEDYVDPASTHPMRNGQPYAMVSAERPDQTPQENTQRTQLLGQILQASGMRSAPTQGSYQGVPEHSYAVQTPSPGATDFVNKVAQQFKQDSVMHVDANQNATLHYGDGRQEWLGSMKQVPAAEAGQLPGWTRDTSGNFYTVKPPGSESGPAAVASASQSIFGDAAKTGGAKDVSPLEQARRAATFKRIGLPEVRQSAITGNAKEASSDFQTAKLNTSGGVRMTQVQDAERNAVVTHADKLVSDSGGSKGLAQPDLESRGRKLAAPIDGYDQALEKSTQRIYDIAKTVAAGKPITLGGLAHVMTKQKSQFLGTVDGKQLLEGVQARMQELGFRGDNDTFNPATIEQAERLRQYIGQQWQPKVTQLVSTLKNHLDNDVAATAGKDIFKQAREIRALRSKVLEEPEGVSRLIQPKEANRLGINRITEFTDIPHMITQLEPDQFGHYIDTLRVISKASPKLHNKAVTALREVRSQFANEYAAEGNKTAGAWNHKAANQYLKKNELNMRKVFTSEELGEYQDSDNAGRWLHQDKSYPGAAAQKENFVSAGLLKGGGKLAEGGGAILGHVPGWIGGKAVNSGAEYLANKVMSSTIEGRIAKLDKGAKGGGVTADAPVEGADTVDALSGLAPKQRGGPKAAAKGPANLQFRHFSNVDDARLTLNPEKYGSGFKGRESTRVAAGAPKTISAYAGDHPDDQVEHELRGKTEYRISVPSKKMYDLSADPKDFIGKSMAKTDGVYDHTEVEKLIKNAGYQGYHLPTGEGNFKGQGRFFQPTPAVRADTLQTNTGRPLSLSFPRQRGGPAYNPYDNSKTATQVKRNNPTYDGAGNPYDTAPKKPDPWSGERTKNERGGPAMSSVFSRQRGGPKFEAPSSITKYLTDQEKAQLRTDTAQRMVQAFNDLPHTNELAAAALAGEAKRGWYDQSAKAITNVFGPDATRFTALLAAMSPQTSVQMNFHNALRSFIGWDKAGRPTDPAAIRKIMEASSLKSPVAKEGGSNVLDAWFNNSVRALTDPEPEKLTLSGPKVDSFMKNLMGHVNAVTLDAWMASFAHIDPSKLAGTINQSGPGKSPTYLAYSAKVREAAAKLTKLTGDKWSAAEVQETVWSWAKTAYEHADEFGSMASIPELVKNGEVTDELIKSTPAFHDLFSEAGHSASLRDSKFSDGLGRLHEGAGPDAGKGASSEKRDAAARTLKPHLYKAAERLEGVRRERSAAKGKTTSPLMGDDTEF